MNKCHFFKEIFLFHGVIILIASCYSASPHENQGQNQLKLNLKSKQYRKGVSFEMIQGWIDPIDLESSIFLFEISTPFTKESLKQFKEFPINQISDFEK